MQEQKQCSQCGRLTELAKGGKGKPTRTVCKPCWNVYQQEWRDKNRARWNELQSKYHRAKKLERPDWVLSERTRARRYWYDLRQKALDHYGRACACCGETIDEFLTLDHMDNDGAAHRRALKTNGAGVWKWLRDNNYPANFQTLCMNCNFGKHKNKGTCPHKATCQSVDSHTLLSVARQ